MNINIWPAQRNIFLPSCALLPWQQDERLLRVSGDELRYFCSLWWGRNQMVSVPHNLTQLPSSTHARTQKYTLRPLMTHTVEIYCVQKQNYCHQKNASWWTILLEYEFSLQLLLSALLLSAPLLQAVTFAIAFSWRLIKLVSDKQTYVRMSNTLHCISFAGWED